MNNYINVKVTVWYRLHFNEYANMGGIADLIKENGLDEVIDEKIGFVDSVMLHETQERLTPAGNNNEPTIEVYAEGKEVWNNKVE